MKTRENQQEYALLLYMQGMPQNQIAQKVGVSEKTVSNWSEKFNWKQKRASTQITRQELINKTLTEINRIFESGDVNADALIKLANVIEKLDKKASVVDYIQTFTRFLDWCTTRSDIDKGLSMQLIQDMSKYQNIFIHEVFENKI